MRTIWKYPIPVGTTFELELPRGAIVRHIGAQEEGPVMWVEVDSKARPILRRFYMAGTGDAIPENEVVGPGPFGNRLVYLGTYQFYESEMTGPFVQHVFEIEQEVAL